MEFVYIDLIIKIIKELKNMCVYKGDVDATYTSNPYVEENLFKSEVVENSPLPQYENIKNLLPIPIWENHSDVVECYSKAWELAFKNIRRPTEGSGFVSNFVDTAFSDCLFMWDSCFILMFGKYGIRAFDFQKTLDNFYAKQHKDGFISREISEITGLERFHRFDYSSTGPNILAWTEWEYYLNFGDEKRLKKVFPVLVAYHMWLKEFRTWPGGGYWSSGWGCGMDNLPRLEKQYNRKFSHGNQVWIDTCLQQILNGKILTKISEIIGRKHEMTEIEEEIDLISNLVNEKLWDDKTSFYYDLWKNGSLNYVKTIGSYWALLASVVPKDKLDAFIGHLENPIEFKRPHPIPSLSADDKDYSEEGSYWRGGVWAPTNYMVLRGLSEVGHDALAHEIACKHVDAVVKVFTETGTLYENYAPEKPTAGNVSKADFVGWTGLVPISVLFEFVFGINADKANNTIVWRVNLLEEHGILKYPFGNDGLIDLKCEKRSSISEKPIIQVQSNVPLTVHVIWEGGEELLKF